ncbi:MAG: TonB-dependent receptor [Sphingomonadales bacterium]|nr:TonB-dependent receptor [Sphingomonadales bacterium]
MTSSTSRLRHLFAGAAILALVPGAAYAQDAKPSKDKDDFDIVVTGTLIRGQQVTGSQTVTVAAQQIEQLGAGTTQEVLASIPQFGSFNQIPVADPRSNALISFGRVNLRSIPGFNKGSGSITLTLVDGHRVAGVGVFEDSVDPDSVPSAILERLDVVTDGGSSLYGADAIAGVANFITKKQFDGIKLDGTLGLGNELTSYKQYNGSITAGKNWSNGGAYISFGYDANSNVTNGDTTWARSGLWSGSTFLPQGTQCLSPVGTSVTKAYIPGYGWIANPAIPGTGTTASGTKCDDFLAQSYFPKQRRYNVFASVYQQISDNIDFRMTGSYTDKRVTFSAYPIGMTTTAQAFPASAAPMTFLTLDAGTAFSFGANSAYRQRLSYNAYSVFNISPEFTITLNKWQVHASANYGESSNHFRNPGVNQTLAQADINAGVFTPATVSSLSATELNNILNWEDATDTKHREFDARVYADGPLFALPGGDAKLAVGAEYQNNRASNRFNTGAIDSVNSTAYRTASQHATSIFGEVSLPVFSMLDLSASVRYDHYSNFGGTTNPTLAAKFKPFEWLSIYGHWGKSFNAPTALDSLAVTSAQYIAGGGLQCSVASPCVDYRPGVASATAGGVVLLTGSSNNLLPQTATEWTLGFDAKPTSRLNFGVEYYNIHLRNLLGSINPANPQVFTVSNPANYAFGNGNTTIATSNPLYQAIVTAANGSTAIAQINANGKGLGEIVDFRVSNVNDIFASGLDFHARLQVPTANAGDFTISLNGNKALETKSTKGPAVDYLQDGLVGSGPTFNASASLGWSLKNWSTNVTVNYSGAYNSLDYANAAVKVSAFTVANLFVGYKFGGEGLLSKSSLRLIVDNVFNRTPQIVQENSPGPLSYKGWTLGRVIKLGATLQY